MSQGFQFNPQSQEFKILATSFTFTPPKLPVSPEQEVIKKAQESLDRLDFKSAEEICTQALEDESFSDVSALLLIRSTAAQRRGRLDQSFQDASRALKSGERKDEAHLRSTFVHLGLALSHLDSHRKEVEKEAQQKEAAEQKSSPFSKTDDKHKFLGILDLTKLLSEAKKKELRGPFRRVSQDLFVKIIRACDAPSISICAAVNSEWRRILFENKLIFGTFQMKGKEVAIIKGLELFGRRSGHQIKEVEIEFLESFRTNYDLGRFKTAITNSSKAIESLSIKHHGGVGAAVVFVLGKCQQIKQLRFIELEKFAAATRPAATEHNFSGGDSPSLQLLEWKSTTSKLVTNSDLLESLKQAKSVSISGGRIDPQFVVDLLSSASDLQTVELNGIGSEPIVDEHKTMNLPNLKHLSLNLVPAPDASLFFENLETPELQILHLEEVDSVALQSFEYGGELKEFKAGKLSRSPSIGHTIGIDDSVVKLLTSMKCWDSLERLKLDFKVTDFTSTAVFRGFFLHLISALTPLSKDRLRGPYNISSIILPNLSFLKLGSGPAIGMADKSCSNGALAVACLVSGRLAAFAGRSRKEIISASNGFLYNSSSSDVVPMGSPRSLDITARLEILDLHFTLGGDPASIKYCRANLSERTVLRFVATMDEMEDDEFSNLYAEEDEDEISDETLEGEKVEK